MRNVYVLLESSGLYEDYIEYPIMAFTSLEKAEEVMSAYEEENRINGERAKICWNCPIAINFHTNEEEFKRDMMRANCRFKHEATFTPEEGYHCPNETWHEAQSYRIVKIDFMED